MHDQRAIPAGWTCRLVAEVMIEALRWAEATAGRVGPAGFATSGKMQQYTPTLEDHLAEGWGLPELDEAPQERRIRRSYTAAELTLYPRAIQWPLQYIGQNHPETGRVLAIWVRYKAWGQAERGWVWAWKQIGYSKSHAHRMKDRGLMMVCSGLHRDHVPMPERITLSE